MAKRERPRSSQDLASERWVYKRAQEILDETPGNRELWDRAVAAGRCPRHRRATLSRLAGVEVTLPQFRRWLALDVAAHEELYAQTRGSRIDLDAL